MYFAITLIGLVIAPVIALIINFYAKFNLKWRNGPPGPLPLPIVGNFLNFLPHRKLLKCKALAELSKKYGDVWRLQLGVKDYVVVSSCDALHDILGREEATGRDRTSGFLRELCSGQNLGFLAAESNTWRLNRLFVRKHLKRLGSDDDTGLEASVMKHTQGIYDQFDKDIAEAQGKRPYSHMEVTEDMFLIPFTKAIFEYVIGGERVGDDKNGALLEKMVMMNAKTLKAMDPLWAELGVAFPFLDKYLPAYKIQKEFNLAVRNAGQVAINDVKAQFGSSSIVCNTDPVIPSITHAFLQNILFDMPCGDPNYISIYRDLLISSGPPLAAAMQAIFFNLAFWVHHQTKIAEESFRVIPKDEAVEWEHLKSMPYTEAFILEVHRTSMITPNLIPRRLTENIQYKDYTIPKDTMIISDLITAHNDARLWKDPASFKVERWFTPGTTEIDPTKRRLVLPFGTGKRRCPGEPQGEALIFCFLVNTVRRFEFGVIPWDKVKFMNFSGGAAMFPTPFNIFVKKRV